MADITINVNGQSHSVQAEPETQLLYVLRDQLKYNGPKFGCGLTQCGACTVLIDGEPVRSCLAPLSEVGDREVITLDGLADTYGTDALQRAFIDEQAAQCGYCINGMIMTAQAFLMKNPSPTTDEIKQALANNLCRCGTHLRIVKAVERAASEGVTA